MLVEAFDEESDLENYILLGLVLVYVDDFMILGYKDSLLWFEKELRARWEATELEWATIAGEVLWHGHLQGA